MRGVPPYYEGNSLRLGYEITTQAIIESERPSVEVGSMCLPQERPSHRMALTRIILMFQITH